MDYKYIISIKYLDGVHHISREKKFAKYEEALRTFEDIETHKSYLDYSLGAWYTFPVLEVELYELRKLQ